MSNLFVNFGADPRIQKQALINKYSAARINLLLLIVFSVVNLISLVSGIGVSFFFSAAVPCVIVELSMLFCGMFPAEYYEAVGKIQFLDKSVFILSLVLALIILALYVLCWRLSKGGKSKWLKIGLTLVVADTLVLIICYGLSALINLGFHIWLIYMIYSGIKAQKTLQSMPKENYIEGHFTELDDDDEEIYEQERVEAPEIDSCEDDCQSDS